MLQTANILANGIIFAGTLWMVLSKRVPTGSGAALVLWILNFAALGNIIAVRQCHSQPEVLTNIAAAIAMCWAFYQVEVRRTFRFQGTQGW